ncbi:hypothetical protein JQS43_16655 [Natronosporangium hydrolyticum]|uniref:Uncharacterized protein n=1 Tax=Natronosporangium hydrolyticum TaxID=2811111 RepID=A0A895YCS8_9ACTN|nr:hypothetical protein [Natronosporangium hydrolyticum]QSB13253.1 hypothetical protein JQS43_16655 [Natronosporangium hydrolyticum]
MYAPAKVAHEIMSGEELLENVYEDDIEHASALIYPDDHPRAGEIIPLEEWEREQRAGWERFVSFRDNEVPIYERTYDRMIEEVSPEEFRSRVHPHAEERVTSLFYPAGHPQAGEFIPSAEWQDGQLGDWTSFLTLRPDDLPCP